MPLRTRLLKREIVQWLRQQHNSRAIKRQLVDIRNFNIGNFNIGDKRARIEEQ
jgi:hypothetical protein